MRGSRLIRLSALLLLGMLLGIARHGVGGSNNHVKAAAGSILLTTNKTVYAPGETVQITATNNGPTAIDRGFICGNDGNPRILAGSQLVYRPPIGECAPPPESVRFAPNPLNPGSSLTFSWNQRATNIFGTPGSGQQVPPGVYTIHVSVGGVQATTDITVAKAAAGSILLTTNKTVYAPGETVQITATNNGPTAIDRGFICGTDGNPVIFSGAQEIFSPPPGECRRPDDEQLRAPNPLNPGNALRSSWNQKTDEPFGALPAGQQVPPGVYTIHVSVGGVQATTDITVAKAAAGSILLTTNKTVYAPGETVQITTTNNGPTAIDRGFICGNDGNPRILAGSQLVYRPPIGECAPPPESVRFAPNPLNPGSSLTFSWNQRATNIFGTPGSGQQVPPGVYTIHVSVGGVQATTDITVNASAAAPAPPLIQSISPPSGPIGTTVTLIGSNFGAVNDVLLDGQSGGKLLDLAASANRLTFVVPGQLGQSCSFAGLPVCKSVIRLVSPGVYKISVLTNGLRSDPVTFTVTAKTPTPPIVYKQLGHYTSPPLGPGYTTNFTRLVLDNQSKPAGTDIQVEVASAKDNYSKWTQVVPNAQGEVVFDSAALPQLAGTLAMKVRLILVTSNVTITPSLRSFHLYHAGPLPTPTNPSTPPVPTPLVINRDPLAYQYQYIDQDSHQLTLHPGESHLFTLHLKNTGTATWVQGTVNLGTSNADDRGRDRVPRFIREDQVNKNPSGWVSPNRVRLVESSVAPGQTGTFQFYYTVPTDFAPGVYKEYFQPVAETITWFKNFGIYWEITVAPASPPPPTPAPSTSYHASFVSQTRPVDVIPGEAVSFEVKLKNTGTTTWQKGTVMLATDHDFDRTPQFIREDKVNKNPSGWASSSRVDLVETSVAPGQIGTFRFYYTIPTNFMPGTYREYFRPVAGTNQLMDDLGIFWDLKVIDRARGFHTSFVSQNDYPTLTKGQSYQFEVKLKNTGRVTWEQTTVRLATDRNRDRVPRFIREDQVNQNPSGWISPNRVQQVEQYVRPGETGTYRFFYTVPADLPAGIYHEYFRLVADGVTSFDDLVVDWDVTVR